MIESLLFLVTNPNSIQAAQDPSVYEILRIIIPTLSLLVAVYGAIYNHYKKINRWKANVVKEGNQLSSSMRIGTINRLLDSIVRISEGEMTLTENPICLLDGITKSVNDHKKELERLLRNKNRKLSESAASFHDNLFPILNSFRQCINDISFLVNILHVGNLDDMRSIANQMSISEAMRLSFNAVIDKNPGDIISEIVSLRFADRIIPDYEQQLDHLVNEFADKMQAFQTKKTSPIEWFFVRKRASPESRFSIAEEMFENGNYYEAVEWYKLAAEQGSADAQYRLGECFETGKGCPISLSDAANWYESAAKKGLACAEYKIGKCLYEGLGREEDIFGAVNWYMRAAEKDFPLAQHSLGLCYLAGRGIKQDNQKCIEWLTKAAEKNHIPAQALLGFMLICFSHDDSAGLKWLRTAAENGDTWAMYVLGALLLSDKVKVIEAKYWIEKSADEGFPAAKTLLGSNYMLGSNGFPEDMEKGALLFKDAAEAGDRCAQHHLGFCYFFGDGIQQSYKSAEKWFKESVSNHYNAAYLGLAYVHLAYGQYSEAVECLHLAVQAGSPEAAKLLSLMYEYGLGTDSTSEEIVHFYNEVEQRIVADGNSPFKSYEDPYANHTFWDNTKYSVSFVRDFCIDGIKSSE